MFHSLNQSLVKLHPHVLLIIEHNNMKCQCFTLLLSSFPLDPSIHRISNHMSILLGNNIKIYMQFLIRMFADALILHCKSFRLLGKQFTFAALITSSNEGKKKKKHIFKCKYRCQHKTIALKTASTSRGSHF